MTTVGQYRDRVTFKTEARTPDGMGSHTVTWVDYATVWADVRYGRVQEGERVDAILSSAALTIMMRYRTDLTSAMRVAWNGQTYEVTSLVDPDGRRRQLKIAASQV